MTKIGGNCQNSKTQMRYFQWFSNTILSLITKLDIFFTEFIVGDFFQVIPLIYTADVIFLSPPWGGPEYLGAEVYDLQSMIPMDGIKIFDEALKITENIAYYVPKNTNVDQLISLAGPGGNVEIEQNILNTKVKTVTAYFGELIKYE